jgi:hypothetical protein
MMFKSHTIRETRTTTNGTRKVFGRSVACIKNLWAIEGKFGKEAGKWPFLTSAAECRRYINELVSYQASDEGKTDAVTGMRW